MKEDTVQRAAQPEQIMENFHCGRRKMFSEGALGATDLGISFSQWRVLAFICAREQTPLKDIAESLGMSSSAATQIVDSLVEVGYAVRTVDPADRRISSIVLSPKAKKLFTAMKVKILERMKPLFSVLTNDELTTFVELSGKVFA